HRLPPHRAALRGIDAEALQLCEGGRLAGAPVHAAVRDEIERGDALGHARGMVVAGRHEDDAVAEPDAPRPLRGGRQEDLGRRRVRVLLEEVMLDFPRGIDAEAISELDLVERVLEEAPLAVRSPRPWKLVLVEDAESHAVASWNG